MAFVQDLMVLPLKPYFIVPLEEWERNPRLYAKTLVYFLMLP